MKNRQIAKKFMKTKARLLEIEELASPLVMEWLDFVPEEQLEQWFDRLRNCHPDFWGDDDICPFCTILEFQCSSCPWGETYGQCSDPQSLYRETLETEDDSYWLRLGAEGRQQLAKIVQEA